MSVYEFRPANSPLLVSVPHSGLHIPGEIAATMTEAGRGMPDTDWHVDRLYEFLDDDIGLIEANCSRYVVDLNRSPTDRPLYPGQLDTGLCPTETFDGAAIYRSGEKPGADEIESRIGKFWAPYHEKLATELARLKELHGFAILWDAHSIRSRVPRLFADELPALNLGTNDGRSCDEGLTARLVDCLEESGRSFVLNGRFKGGYITRHYGAPADGVHAIQLEISQRCYMDGDETEYSTERAERLHETLAALFATLEAFA